MLQTPGRLNKGSTQGALPPSWRAQAQGFWKGMEGVLGLGMWEAPRAYPTPCQWGRAFRLASWIVPVRASERGPARASTHGSTFWQLPAWQSWGSGQPLTSQVPWQGRLARDAVPSHQRTGICWLCSSRSRPLRGGGSPPSLIRFFSDLGDLSPPLQGWHFRSMNRCLVGALPAVSGIMVSTVPQPGCVMRGCHAQRQQFWEWLSDVPSSTGTNVQGASAPKA